MFARRFRLSGFLALLLLHTTWASATQPLQVVATTAMVADLVRQVAADRATVHPLMGPGVDPHLYKASASDVLKLQRADVIFFNGLMLEGKMSDLFGRMKRRNPHIYAVTARLPADRLLAPDGQSAHPDPHVWFDVALWAECVESVVRGLSEADPAGAAGYAERGDIVRQQLLALDQWVRAKTAELPPKRRIVVTSHDAYGYFGRAYGFQVVGLQGISTVSEAALADVAKLVDFIKEHDVPAIFVESSVPPGTIRRIASDAGVAVGGELFSDALGGEDEVLHGFPVGTYEGMIRYNVTTLVESLR